MKKRLAGIKLAPDLLVGRQSHTNTKMRHHAQSGAIISLFDRVMTLFLCLLEAIVCDWHCKITKKWVNPYL